MNLKERFSQDVIEQAEREIHQEDFRAEVERVKAILSSRQERWQRLITAGKLMRAAFYELFPIFDR